jgi:hypothetical protein
MTGAGYSLIQTNYILAYPRSIRNASTLDGHVRVTRMEIVPAFVLSSQNKTSRHVGVVRQFSRIYVRLHYLYNYPSPIIPLRKLRNSLLLL